MTLAKTQTSILTDEEWEELVSLKNAINERPQSVVPEKLEQFTEYLVRSLREKGG